MGDPVLAGLVAGVGRSSTVLLPVTLMSRGLVIEGDLVAESRWLDELARLLDAGSPAVAELGRVFREAGVSSVMASAVGDNTSSELLHLVSATVRAGQETLSTGLWRLRVDAVDGWRLGRSVAPLRAVEG